jgi:hypothetical protein
VPNSGSADNSQAASEALVQLVHNLDEAIQSFDFGGEYIGRRKSKDANRVGPGEPSDQLQLQLERLSNEAAKYSNSKVDETAGSQWTW